MKKTFTIIANCQTCIVNFLFSNPIFEKDYKYIQLYAVHTTTKDDIENIYKIIYEVDLLIIQPINDNYKNIENFGTYNILSRTKPSCKIILFPSLYLKFYFPFCTYVFNKKTNRLLQQPIDYHDINLLNICKNNSSFETVVEKFRESVNDKNIISSTDLHKNYNESINELRRRENEYNTFIPDSCKDRSSIIYSSEFINNNYKKVLLFYSMNHPTKYLFYYISDCILKNLNIPLINYDPNIDPLFHNNVPILYKALEDHLNFNISEIPIVINNKTLGIEEFVKTYYDIYSKLDLTDF